MKLPCDVRDFLKRKFQNKHKEWLKAFVLGKGPLPDSDSWPLEINLGIPAEQEALLYKERVQAWISAWRSWRGRGSLVWNERRWRTLGTQSVPCKLILECPDDVAGWIDETTRWSHAAERFRLLVQRWPALADNLSGYFNVLADYSDSDFLNLFGVLSWICANPQSNLYIRQIPVAGIDSKWLEARKNIVSDLIAMIMGDLSDDCDFFRRCGLRPQPQLIRIRILDPDLKIQFGGLCDISSPMEEIAGLCISPKYVFIIENIQTGLAFNDLKNCVVIMGLGYGVDVLGKIPWLHNARCIYWGDIDTHGFVILNRARSYLPHLVSVLMDEKTLLGHRELWVMERDQYASEELPLLTAAELKVFQSLMHNVWGQQIRMEQERIRWDEAWQCLLEAAGVTLQ